jgi:hypothetical protein
MKNLLWAVALALLILGCASEPEPIPAPESEREQATELRETIQKFELQSLAQSDYDAAEVEYKKAEDLYGTDNGPAKTAYDAAISGYESVIRAAFPTLARRYGEETEAVRADSQELKAEVALPEDYAEAEAAYQKALASEKAGNFEAAVDEFQEANELYKKVYAATAEKKARADAAMSAAADGISAAEKRAAELEEAEKTGGTE